MEFEVPKSRLVEALALAQGVVERRSTLPILSNVLIESTDGGLTILASDLEVGIRKFCESTVKSGGSLTVNARKLYEIASSAQGDSIHVKSRDTTGVEISSGRSRFRLVGLDPKEFPSIPGLSAKPGKGATSFRSAAATLTAMIERTLFAVSTDETRLNLSGVYAEGSGQSLRMVATDGHRLAVIDREVEGELPKKGVILPRKGLAEVRKVLDAQAPDEVVTFWLDGSVAKIVTGQTDLFMALVEGEFPDYRQVIPKQGKIAISLDRVELLAALRRVSLLSTERSRGVRLTLGAGSLELKTTNPDLGEATEEVEIPYSGDSLSIGFNARYLTEVLAVMPDQERVDLTVTDDVSPGVLRSQGDEQYNYVVMPMRL